MKNLALILLLSVVLQFQQADAQTNEFKCGTMEYLQEQLLYEPDLKEKMAEQELRIQSFVKNQYDPAEIETITIPIVFHIVYHTDEENVSDQRVYETLEQLNRNYAGLNSNTMGAFPDSFKANTGIQFCMAQRKPDGSPTNGIERRYTSDTVFRTNAVKFL